ncbi:MAG TPA: hypothetical protein VN456_04780 [Desulfosporosinus sp.]|nr:hypothetical protein [Desulfosporosinus sp.]
MDHLDLKSNVAGILSKYPQTAYTFQKFGISTSGCGAKILLSMSIEQAAQRYHINPLTLIKSLEVAIEQSKHQWRHY